MCDDYIVPPSDSLAVISFDIVTGAILHRGEETDATDTTKGTHKGGHALRRSVAGHAETAHARTAQELVDLRRDMETC